VAAAFLALRVSPLILRPPVIAATTRGARARARVTNAALDLGLVDCLKFDSQRLLRHVVSPLERGI